MEKLKEILAKTLRVNVSELKHDTTMHEIDTWNSLTHMELIVGLEQAYQVEFSGDEIVEMVSVDAIHNILRHKMYAD